jgi:hypothetical protein
VNAFHYSHYARQLAARKPPATRTQHRKSIMNQQLTMPRIETRSANGAAPNLTARRTNTLMQILHDSADVRPMSFGPLKILVVSEPKLARAVLVLPPRRSDPVWRRAERSWQGAEPKA